MSANGCLLSLTIDGRPSRVVRYGVDIWRSPGHRYLHGRRPCRVPRVSESAARVRPSTQCCSSRTPGAAYRARRGAERAALDGVEEVLTGQGRLAVGRKRGYWLVLVPSLPRHRLHRPYGMDHGTLRRQPSAPGGSADGHRHGGGYATLNATFPCWLPDWARDLANERPRYSFAGCDVFRGRAVVAVRSAPGTGPLVVTTPILTGWPLSRSGMPQRSGALFPRYRSRWYR